MQAHLLVGPISIAINSRNSAPQRRRESGEARRRGWASLVVAACSSSSPWAIPGEQNHYAVLGLSLSATPADIKRAYRRLARKYHPDVSKDSKAAEVFKIIRRAYEVLSNETTRTQYDRALRVGKDAGRQNKGRKNYDPEFDVGVKIYRWDELRRRMRCGGYWEDKTVKEESFSFNEANGASERNPINERGSFGEVLLSAFVCLFLYQTFGSQLSLTFSSITALLDRKLDAGYKIGYAIAWVLGGRGGILLTLSLSFASWACGKSSSSVVALVVVAMWVGANLARFAPLPQGALLTLLYMSIKLQTDLN